MFEGVSNRKSVNRWNELKMVSTRWMVGVQDGGLAGGLAGDAEGESLKEELRRVWDASAEPVSATP